MYFFFLMVINKDFNNYNKRKYRSLLYGMDIKQKIKIRKTRNYITGMKRVLIFLLTEDTTITSYQRTEKNTIWVNAKI